MFLIVTPAFNEKENIATLASQLVASSVHPDMWIVVDDGSTDGTGAALRDRSFPFEVRLLRRDNDGGLAGGSAFSAWQFGIDSLTSGEFDAMTEVMKLDADVELPIGYLDAVLRAVRVPGVGLVGGFKIDRSDREQLLHVPGSVGLYSREGYEALSELPRKVGFDVMDEIAIRRAGLAVRVLRDQPYSMRRPVGVSQGTMHGRSRNGRVCRWTGYHVVYLMLHVARFAFRQPYVIGSFLVLWGYLTAGGGPYPGWAKRGLRVQQRAKLIALARNPVRWLRRTYGLRLDARPDAT